MTIEWNYLDLFSGIGGFAKGIEEAGVKINNHFFSEIDPAPIRVYQEHFPHAKGVGDVATIRDVSQFGKIDIITFGFPCQDLSLAGKRKGLAGDRSGLFFEAIRLVKELRPSYFIFENVKGIFTSDRGADFVRCLLEIADIGDYDCEWQLVNTSWLLPQNRERIYFIGHARGKSRPKVFPFTEDDFASAFIQRPQINTITTKSGQGDTVGSYVVESEFYEKTKRNSQGCRIIPSSGNSVCLSANGGGLGELTGLYVVPNDRKERIAGISISDDGIRPFQGDEKKSGLSEFGTIHFQDVKACSCLTTVHPPKIINQNKCAIPVLTPSREEKRQNGRRFKENGEPSFTLTTQDQHGVYDGHSIRKLTPMECERLQGFPDGWTAGNKRSDNSRYKMLGNAVSVPIVKMIIERLVAE